MSTQSIPNIINDTRYGRLGTAVDIVENREVNFDVVGGSPLDQYPQIDIDGHLRDVENIIVRLDSEKLYPNLYAFNVVDAGHGPIFGSPSPFVLDENGTLSDEIFFNERVVAFPSRSVETDLPPAKSLTVM